MPSTSSSEMPRKPVSVHGAALVMSSRSEVVVTASNVMVVGASPLPHATSRFSTGACPRPSQYETVSSAGRCRCASTTNPARTVPETVWALGQSTDTHTSAWAAEISGSRAVAAFAYMLDHHVDVLPSSMPSGTVAAAPEKLASADGEAELVPRAMFSCGPGATISTVAEARSDRPSIVPSTISVPGSAYCASSTASQTTGTTSSTPSSCTRRTSPGSAGAIPAVVAVETGSIRSSAYTVTAASAARQHSSPAGCGPATTPATVCTPLRSAAAMPPASQVTSRASTDPSVSTTSTVPGSSTSAPTSERTRTGSMASIVVSPGPASPSGTSPGSTANTVVVTGSSPGALTVTVISPGPSGASTMARALPLNPENEVPLQFSVLSWRPL